MTTLQAFVLGMMVAWSPSLLLLAWYLYRDRARMLSEHKDESLSAARK